MMTMTKTTMMKMRAWNSAKTTMHLLLSKLLQHKILQRKRPRTRQTPKMEAMIDLESLSFSKMLITDLETPLSRMEPALPMVAMAHHNKRCSNTTMIVLITVVVMIEAIEDTKVVETMATIVVIITDAMTTEATVMIDAKTTNTAMTVVAEATVATERIDEVATTIETEAVAKEATMTTAEIEGMVSRIEVPEETIIVNNSSHTISLIATKLILSLIIDFTTRTILISSAGL